MRFAFYSNSIIETLEVLADRHKVPKRKRTRGCHTIAREFTKRRRNKRRYLDVIQVRFELLIEWHRIEVRHFAYYRPFLFRIQLDRIIPHISLDRQFTRFVNDR